MSQKWNSAEEIALHFKTRAQGSEIAALRDEIDAHLREAHPDKSGGDFESEHA